MEKKFLELKIEINPNSSELVCDTLFTNFECEGIITAEEEYKDLELIKTTENIVTAYILFDDESFDEIVKTIKEAREIFIKNGVEPTTLGSWNVKIAKVVNVDWSKKWKENWRPTKISDKIVISPSWIDYEKKDEEIVINIDPGAAFGTGTHQTTQLCVIGLEKYLNKNDSVADIGTGSGILAIIASLLGATIALGIDNDETAIDVAITNAKLNNVENCNFLHAEINSVKEQFDFVTANILHNVLAEIMPDLKRIMKKNAKMVLSGILDTKQETVLTAIEANSLKIVEKIQKDNWVAFVVQN